MFVRWSNLTLRDEEQRRLPGYRDEAVVRRFDAPEALETNFYEVRAKSVLNRVPGNRGCRSAGRSIRIGVAAMRAVLPHGRTPILMADWQTPRIGVISTSATPSTEQQRRARYRRYARHNCARQVDHHQARVPRDVGGRHRADRERRAPFPDKPRLEARNRHRAGVRLPAHISRSITRLLGTGHFAEQPETTLAYRRGYLCGLIRGGGASGRARTDAQTVRLARGRTSG